MTAIADIRTRSFRSLIPPPRLRLSAAWIEADIKTAARRQQETEEPQ